MNLVNMSLLSVARYCTSISVFLFLMLSVSLDNSYAFSGILIVLSSLFLLSKKVRQQISLSRTEKSLIWVLLAYLLSVVVEVVFYSLPLREMDPESKILLLIPLIYLLNAVKINPKVIIYGIGFGALGMFVLALYELFVLEMERIGSFINAIQLGNVALIFGLLSWMMAGFVYNKYRYSKVISLLLVVAGCCGIVASLATLTRGGVVFLPLVAVLVSCYFISEIKHYKKQVAAGFILVVTALFLILPSTEFMGRVQTAFDNVESYFEEGEVVTSSGLRLELWKAAVLISKDNLVFGVGATDYLEQKAALIEAGQIDSSILNYGHSHNAYLFAVVRRGTVGLIFLLALLVYPVVVAHRELRKTDSSQRKSGDCIPALSLLVFGWFFIFANVTQVFFAHNSGMIIYTGLLIILVNFSLASQNSKTEFST